MKFLSSFVVAALGLAATAKADDAAILYKEIARAQNQSLLWGPYRPNLYFGVTPRIPKSFMGGLMWAKVDEFQDVQHSMSLLQWGVGRGES
jgi:mannosyl-oligosaccharide glucosidase